MAAKSPARQRRDAIDPFGADPHYSSRLTGLRDGELSRDVNYAFRTVLMPVPPGPAAFVVDFHAPEGADAEMFLELTTRPADQDTVPVRDHTLVVPVVKIVDAEGWITFKFEAHPGLLYALAGYLEGPGHMSVDAIGIDLSVGHDVMSAQHAEPVDLLRLTDLDMPTLADPVSQPCTRRQLRSRICRDWIARLGLDTADGARAWALAYVAQVLTRYGALCDGARGRCLGEQGRALESLCGGDATGGAIDYLWSVQLGAAPAALGQVLADMIGHLPPEGLGVIVFDSVIWGQGGGVDRPAIERIALDLIADGHDVGQLKFRTGEPRIAVGETTPFGLIVRHRP